MNVLGSLLEAIVRRITVIFTSISNSKNTSNNDSYTDDSMTSNKDYYLHHNNDNEQDIFDYDSEHDDYCSYCDED